MKRNPVQTIAEQMMESHNTTGMAIAWTHGRGTPHYLALGTDRDGVALDKDSLFPVRSIAKLATSLCILRLADAGHLSINDSLAKYLPCILGSRRRRDHPHAAVSFKRPTQLVR